MNSPLPTATNPAIRLGEELPIFCEKCGYSLHGAIQIRCEHCEILQFHCPECGHHQPINTVRPAFTAMVGRLRALLLVGAVVLQLAFFVFTLMGWTAMGVNWAYSYSYDRTSSQVSYSTAELSVEMLVGFVIFGVAFGIASRMILLRWKRGILVGLVLSAIVFGAICLGAWIEFKSSRNTKPSPFTKPFLIAALTGVIAITISATCAWPLWTLLVRAFLPKRAATRLLDWQRAFSTRPNDRAAVLLGSES